MVYFGTFVLFCQELFYDERGIYTVAIFFICMILLTIWATSVYIQRTEKQKKEKRLREEQYEAYMKKVREEEQIRLIELKKQKEEQDRLIAEKNAIYDRTVLSIREYPITISDEKAKKIAISFLNSLTYSTITIRSDIEKLGDFVVVDTETTGLRVVSDEIIEVAAIRFRNFQPVEKFTSLLSPSRPIPEQITEINHITDEMVNGKPCFQQVAASLVEFIGDDNIVGHNLPFDLKFIVHYGANVTTKKRKYFDTLDLAKKTLRGEPSTSPR